MRAGSGVVLENSSVTWPSHSGSKGVTLQIMPQRAYVELCTTKSLATKLCSFGTEISNTCSTWPGSISSTTSQTGPSSSGVSTESFVATATRAAAPYGTDWCELG